MSWYLSPLRPLAVRQGERTIGELDELPLPPDAPHGVVGAGGAGPRQHLVLVGDETVLGAGVTSMADGLPGILARRLAALRDGEVSWQVVGEPGASSLRVHHRLVPMLPAHSDVAVLVVGMHDLLARHSVAEWRGEMAAVLDLLARKAGRVVVCGCPPMGRAPLLRWPLSASLAADARRLDAVTRELCAQRDIGFVSLQEMDTTPEDFAADRLHPGDAGLRRRAEAVAVLL